jgi:hypothetical protein
LIEKRTAKAQRHEEKTRRERTIHNNILGKTGKQALFNNFHSQSNRYTDSINL